MAYLVEVASQPSHCKPISPSFGVCKTDLVWIALIVFVILFLLYGMEKLYRWSKDSKQYLKRHKMLRLVNKQSETPSLPITKEKPELISKSSPMDCVMDTLPQLPPLVRCRARSSFSNDGGITSCPATRPPSPSSYCPSSIPEPHASLLRPSRNSQRFSSSSSNSSFVSLWRSSAFRTEQGGETGDDESPKFFFSTPPRRLRSSRTVSASVREGERLPDPLLCPTPPSVALFYL